MKGLSLRRQGFDFDRALKAKSAEAVRRFQEEAEQAQAAHGEALAALEEKRRAQLLKPNGEAVLDQLDGELAALKREGERLTVGREALAAHLITVTEAEAEEARRQQEARAVKISDEGLALLRALRDDMEAIGEKLERHAAIDKELKDLRAAGIPVQLPEHRLCRELGREPGPFSWAGFLNINLPGDEKVVWKGGVRRISDAAA